MPAFIRFLAVLGFLVASYGPLRAQGRDCEKWIGNVFNQSSIISSEASKKAFEKFTYKANFKDHDEAISAGLDLGVKVYGVPLSVGGKWDQATKDKWMEEHKDYQKSAEDFQTLRYEVIRTIDPNALKAYRDCINTNGMRLDATRVGRLVYVSVSCQFGTGDTPFIESITHPGLSVIDNDHTLIKNAVVPNTDGGIGAVFQLNGSQGSVTVTIRSKLNPNDARTATQFISTEDDIVKSSAIVGEIRAFASGSPAFIARLKAHGWMVCDGSSYPTKDYPELSECLTSQWGTSADPTDGSFKVPNLSGQFLRGARMGSNSVDPEASRVVGSSQSHAIRKHNHSVNTRVGDFSNLGYSPNPPNNNSNNWSWQGGLTGDGTSKGGGTYRDVNEGEPGGKVLDNDETRPINKAVLYCVFAGRRVK